MQMRVDVERLNFRSEPRVAPQTLLGSLDLASAVDVLGDSDRSGWVRARASVEGVEQDGFVASRFLRDEARPSIESLIGAAVEEWRRFKYGLGKEHETPFFRFVGEMWTALGLDLDGRDRDVPWSAAAISFMMRRAGPAYDNFRFAAAHARFINDAINKRQEDDATAPYWGFRLWERRPSLGDLVCQWREVPRTFDDAAASAFFKSHTDIVVRVEPTRVRAIGGNVDDSVSIKSFSLTSDGHLAERNRVFALLGNQTG